MADHKPLEAAVTQIGDLPLRRVGKPVGRDELLRALLSREDDEPLILHGAPGMGKTAIAATIASAHLRQQNRSVLWLPVDEAPFAELLIRIARAYGAADLCSAPNPLTIAPFVKDLLTAHQPLIALDGGISDETLSRFRAECAPDLPLIVTSSRAMSGGDGRNQAVGGLSEADAAELFKQKAGIEDESFDAAAAEIAGQLDGKPLAVALAARSMIISRQSPDECRDGLTELLEECDGDGDAAALTGSFRALNPALSALLTRLGNVPTGEASLPFLRALSDLPAPAIDQSMTILSRLLLVDRFNRGELACYRLHDLTRDFLRRQAQDDESESITDAVRAFIASLDESDESRAAMMNEMRNLVAAASAAAETDDGALAGEIVAAIAERARDADYDYEITLLEALREGETLDFDAMLEAADSAEEADEADADESQSAAEPADEAGDIDADELKAVTIDQLRTALHVARENNETERQLQILAAIAKLQLNQSRQGDAIATYGEALDIHLEADDTAGALDALDALAGIVSDAAGKDAPLDAARLNDGLRLAQRHADRERALQIFDAIGKAQIGQKREKDAIETYTIVLEMHDSADDKAGALAALDMLSGLLSRTDGAVSALNHIQRGLQLAAALDDRETEMFLRITSGDARRALGESVTAIEAYEAALAIARERDDAQNEARIMHKLGLAQLDAGDHRGAIAMLESANERFKQDGQRDMEGKVLRGLGEVNASLARYSEAVNFHTSALYIARETDDRDGEGAQLRTLGALLIQADRLPEALTSYRQALHVAYENDDADEIVGVIGELVALMLRNRYLASIAELLISDGLTYAADDRELLRLQSTVQSAKEQAAERGTALAVVAGTAKEYAANAYNFG